MQNITGSYTGKLSTADACRIDAPIEPTDIVLSLDDDEDHKGQLVSIRDGFLGLRVRGGARVNIKKLMASAVKNDLVQLWNGGVSIEHLEADHSLPCFYSDENHSDILQAFAKKAYGDFGPLPVFKDLYIGSAKCVIKTHGPNDKKNGFVFSEVCSYENISLFSNGLEFISDSSAPYFLDATNFQNAVIGSKDHPIDPLKVSGKAIRIGGQKSGAPKCKNIAIHAYSGLKIVLSEDAKANTVIYTHERPKEVVEAPTVTAKPKQSFSEWIDSLKNLNAPAVTERDIIAAAQRVSLSPAIMDAVSTVESRGKGYNDDGSLRALLERHKVDEFSEDEGCLAEMVFLAGSDVCNPNAGGYIGGIPEYSRIKRVGAVNGRVALLSSSFGRWQIMGFNHKVVGYDTPEEMVEAFSKSEAAQLDAFVQFIIANDLVKHLQEAERLADAGKSPLKPLDAFADGYNGTKHKRYDLKIAAAYKAEKSKREGYTVKPTMQSTTVQGGVTATVGTLGAGALAVKELLDGINQTKEVATEIITDTAGTVHEVTGSNNNYILWAIIALLVLAQFGVFTSLWARIKDRMTGINL